MAQYEIDIQEVEGERFDHDLQQVVKSFAGLYSVMLSGDCFANSTRKRMEIGIVAEKPGSPINFLPPANAYPKEIRDQFAEMARAKLAEKLAAKGLTDTNRDSTDPPTVEDIEKTNELLAKVANNEQDSEDDESSL